MTIAHSYFDGFQAAYNSAGQTGSASQNHLIEYSYFTNHFSSPTAHGCWININAKPVKNFTLRYSVFTDCTGTSCMEEHENYEGVDESYDVYGNIFMNNEGGNGVITTLAGGTSFFSNLRVYNNVFYGNTAGALVQPCINAAVCGFATGNVAKNNVVMNSTAAMGGGLTYDYNSYYNVTNQPSETNGQTLTSSPFVNAAGGDFHLAYATAEGDTSIGATYNTDPDGETRGDDGHWDRGAYEFGGGAPRRRSHPFIMRRP